MCVGRYGQNITAPQIGIVKYAHQSNAIHDKKYGSVKREFGAVSLPSIRVVFRHATSVIIILQIVWSNWSQPTECESGCLYGESGRLREGSTGLRMYTRNCLDYK